MNAMNQEAAHIRRYLQRTNISQENRERAEAWLAAYETRSQKRRRENNSNNNTKAAKKKRSCRKTRRR